MSSRKVVVVFLGGILLNISLGSKEMRIGCTDIRVVLISSRCILSVDIIRHGCAIYLWRNHRVIQIIS
jgi:hypothetical protein